MRERGAGGRGETQVCPRLPCVQALWLFPLTPETSFTVPRVFPDPRSPGHCLLLCCSTCQHPRVPCWCLPALFTTGPRAPARARTEQISGQ